MKDVHMNFSQIECFVALADTGSFTEAAYTTHVTQSAVSHALAALEAELGVSLLERTRKGVVALTDVGRAILPHARAILASASSIEQEARTAQGQAKGRLRLGSTEFLVAPGLLAGVLTRFHASYADIEVTLFEGAMHEVGEWIENSLVDIGFALLPAPEFAGTPITTDEMCVLVGPKHPLREKATVTRDDLREEGFVMERTQCALQLLKRAGFVSTRTKSRIRYQAGNSATILAMVRQGLGITLALRGTLPGQLDGVVALPLDPPQRFEIGLVVKSQESASRAAQLFTQTALAWMRE
jgi:DNA-binding transcriptional LysR family regulator